MWNVLAEQKLDGKMEYYVYRLNDEIAPDVDWNREYHGLFFKDKMTACEFAMRLNEGKMTCDGCGFYNGVGCSEKLEDECTEDNGFAFYDPEEHSRFSDCMKLGEDKLQEEDALAKEILDKWAKNGERLRLLEIAMTVLTVFIALDFFAVFLLIGAELTPWIPLAMSCLLLAVRFALDTACRIIESRE